MYGISTTFKKSFKKTTFVYKYDNCIRVNIYFLERNSSNHIVIWRFICSEKWSDLENARSHNRHWNGRSPVCFLLCLVSSSLRVNFQPQPFAVQMYGFSPVCVLWCAFIWLDLVYVLAQPSWGHWWIICLRSDVFLFRDLATLPVIVERI